jgi:polysaccharide pyruvyl transferase WcaK-like protein
MTSDTVSLAYSYGCRNAGDFAINQGSLSLIEQANSNLNISTIARFSEGNKEYQQIRKRFDDTEREIRIFGGPISYDPESQSGKEQLYSLVHDGIQYGFDLTGMFRNSRFHSSLFEQITSSDMFLFNGGNAIHYSPSHQSLPYLLAVLYPLHIAQRNNIPYGILPQTVFGLEGVAKRIVIPILNDAEFVMARDMETFRYLSQFDLSTQVINAIDTAFLNGDPTDNSHRLRTTYDISIVPRFSTLGDTDELDGTKVQMEQTFFEYLEKLVTEGHNVTVTVQTEIDAQWVNRNRGRLDGIGVSYCSENDPQSLRAHYAGQDLLVTMRLHAAIFALSMGTPAIGVYRSEWGPKISGTFETLDLEEFVLPWEKATLEALTSVTSQALDEIDTLSETVSLKVSNRTDQLVSEFTNSLHRANWTRDV